MAAQHAIRRRPWFQDLSGLVFGRWTVISTAPSRGRKCYWNCICKCGRLAEVSADNLRSGSSKSCRRCSRTTHGMSHLPEYRTWHDMRSRCECVTDTGYADYGGRGITICDEWRSFEAFYRDMGPKPFPEATIERNNNDLGYSLDNCRWATQREQSRNKRTTRFLELNGQTMSVADWADATGLQQHTILSRLRSGWSVERALTTPLQRNHVRSPSVS